MRRAGAGAGSVCVGAPYPNRCPVDDWIENDPEVKGTVEVRFFKTATELRSWFTKNHDTKSELWIGFYKKDAGKKGMTYLEAINQALCFGWIDGIRKRLDDISYTNRFTPRTARSNWSDVNIKRFRELSKQGLMHPAGLAAFESRTGKPLGRYSYEARPGTLEAAYEKQFRKNPKAWDFFESQPPGYRRMAIWWVMNAKKEETRLKRLATLIEDSQNGRRLAILARPPTSK